MAESTSGLDGLVTFYASHHAMRAEKVLRRAGFVAVLVPGPREISPNCGVALQFDHSQAEKVQELLAQRKVQIEAIWQYRIELSEDVVKRMNPGQR